MPEEIQIVTQIMNANDTVAQQNREAFDRASLYSINLIASPGAGKTSLIEQTLKIISPRYRISVINGDLATQLDKERAQAAGAIAVNINTGGECHLDAVMVQNALTNITLTELDLLIVENVGNLICPASFKLGTHHTAVIASVPEGDDKPYKYPGTFLQADLILLNKIDLLPYVPFDKEKFFKGIKLLNPDMKIFEISCTRGDGIMEWCDWLTAQITFMKSNRGKSF